MPDSDKVTAAAGVRAIRRSIAVLQAVNRNGSVTVTDIAQSADLPYPTALRIVRTLCDEGLIEQEPSRKRYRATALVQTLACGFQNNDRLVSAARPHIVALTNEVDWPITVVTRVGKMMMVRDSTSASTSLTFNVYHPGWQVPLLASASGRVYFAHATADEQAELLRNYHPDQPGIDTLMLREFKDGKFSENIRQQGYASVERTEYSANPGKTSSISVPLFEGEKLLGALTLVFFSNAASLALATKQLLAPLMLTADAIRADLEKHCELEPGIG